MLAMAGLDLEPALFTPLVLVGKLGPIGVVRLADRVGRDYATVSRSVARLEELGLVNRRVSTADRRTREEIITRKGQAATDAVDVAREEIALTLFMGWSHRDFDISLQKEFPIHNEKSIEFRAEFINFTNTPIYYSPATGLGPSLGQITHSQGPRNIQFVLKFYF